MGVEAQANLSDLQRSMQTCTGPCPGSLPHLKSVTDTNQALQKLVQMPEGTQPHACAHSHMHACASKRTPIHATHTATNRTLFNRNKRTDPPPPPEVRDRHKPGPAEAGQAPEGELAVIPQIDVVAPAAAARVRVSVQVMLDGGRAGGASRWAPEVGGPMAKEVEPKRCTSC